jgi:hypothetical protein
VYERQKCASWHKSSKEHLLVMCSRNAFGNDKLALAANGRAKKKNLSREPKQTAFLSIITIRNEHGWKGSLFLIGSTSIFFQKFGLF